MWLGFCAVEVPPSPNVQDQEVGLPVDVSVKATVRGGAPEVGLPVKFATGVAGFNSSRQRNRSEEI